MLYAPVLVTDANCQSASQRRKAHLFALLLFTVAAGAGLLLKYFALG